MTHTLTQPIILEHLDTLRQVDYIILKDGIFYAEAWYSGFDGECHVFVDQDGRNCKHYIKNLDDYAFAQSLF
jgi:hypothetical protein